MGTQSLRHPTRRACAPSRIALLLMLFILSGLPVPQSEAQTTVSAITVPLLLPSAIIFDQAGNLYIAETANHVIREVDVTGNITTIAGNGTQGFSGDNGPATNAQLDSPQGLALDTADNLYIADTHNHVIRKLNLATGILTTIAGTGSPGFAGDGGPATSAHLDLPTALALDKANNLYFADTRNHRIRRIDATTGIITTTAGTGTQGFSGDNGPAIFAAIDSPAGLALDTANNLYFADTHNHRIRRIDAVTGIITTIAGTGSPSYSGDNSQATASTLALPHGLAIDAAGNLYLADTQNNRIRRIDATTGIITTIAGSGIQGFSGDNGLATAATLDTPRDATFSPTTLLTLADTGNQRVRQLDAQPASTTTIQTIAGLGLTTPGALVLSAPSVIAYGTGNLIATLNTTTPATGVITFFQNANATTSTLAATPLAASTANPTATLNTSTLSAGLYNITATYAGDQTHSSAQSSAFALTISPRQINAAVAPITLLYGQPIPHITATLTGLLPQDTSNFTADFTTTAASLSPPGTYPFSVAISGSAAGNYAVTITPPNLTINPAPTQIILTDLLATSTTLAPGAPLTLTSHVATTTAGQPTGTVSLLDGSTSLLTSPVSPSGDSTFTTSALAAGTHTLTAVYNGDANFTRSTSTSALVTIGTGSAPTADFTLSATGTTTQTVVSGSTASFTFAVQLQGNLASPITLAATGLPSLATASFNPAYLPPGVAPNFTLTIATPNTTALQQAPATSINWAFVLLPAVGLIFRPRNSRSRITLIAFAIASLTLTFCAGCGDRINTANLAVTPPKTYVITVTGTATTPTSSTLQHSATVSLVLQTPN
jgi:sugar lactone lactonase YvrE